MEQAVTKKHLAHYFIPEVNILEEYPHEPLGKASHILGDINKDLQSYIPEEVLEVADSVDSLVTGTQMVIAETMQKRFNKQYSMY